ncbi:MAG: HD domain-containing protein [Leptolinea sp.]
MNSTESNLALGLISRLREIIDPADGAWLVGGVVRDQLTGTVSHDVDIIVPGEARRIARRVADSLNGKFFPLDETRGMYRIRMAGADGQMKMVDVSRLQAETVEDDLRLRDFTVNAIAVRLHESDVFVDPLNGRRDLKDRILRLCSEFSLNNDPIRVIRAARLSLEFNLRFASGLLSAIRVAGPMLRNTSVERQRDELFKIFEGNHPVSAIRLLDTFGVLELLLPDVTNLKGVQQSMPHTMDVYEHTLATLDQLKRLLDLFLSPQSVLEDGGNLTLGLAGGKFGVFREHIKKHYQISLNPFRKRKSLILFGALLHDIGKPETKSIGLDGRIHFYQHESRGADLAVETARSMALIEAETDALARMVELHMRPRFFSKNESLPTRRSVYRFYRQAKDFGVDTCLLSLADYLAKTVYPPQQGDWVLELERIAVFLEGWFEQKRSWVEPARLVRGEEIMKAFQLPPGRMIGAILEAILEAQAVGEISNRQEALEYAKEFINNPERRADE